MKRIIPFLFLAVAFGACQDEGPTVPSDTPLFAKPDKCEPWPACKDGNGSTYAPIDLEICPRCDGGAHDISEPANVDDPLHVVGWINEFLGWPTIAVVWTGTAENIGDATPVILNTEGYGGPGSGSPGVALGINDDANSIVGWNYKFEQPRVPVIWQQEAGGTWRNGDLLHLDDYTGGNARDVNNAYLIAGRLTSEQDTVAVTWASLEAGPLRLEDDLDVYSAALGLNNDGDVVGRIWDASGVEEAVLWLSDGTPCNLNPQESKSVALRVDDRIGGNTVLVAGRVTPPGEARRPIVWTVTVASDPCIVTYEMLPGAGRAHDIRSVGSGWEAVGVDETGRDERPMVWFDMTGSELLHGKLGNAYVISDAGHIVGRRTHRGHLVPVLWTN